jgi:pyruvate dehydrogenase complex dehydrogenase (E1) component
MVKHNTAKETKMTRTALVKILRAEFNVPFSDKELVEYVAKNENNSFSPALVEMARNINTPRVKPNYTAWNGVQR